MDLVNFLKWGPNILLFSLRRNEDQNCTIKNVDRNCTLNKTEDQNSSNVFFLGYSIA